MTTFTLFLSNFHFIRPYWLLAIFALLAVLWLLRKHKFHQSPWQQFLPSHLSQVLVEGSSKTNHKNAFSEKIFLIKPFIIGLLSIVALAGPVWQKLPQPVYQTERGSVLIMDMSYSMYATDIKPNRLTRARFKAIDLLNKINEGDTGLIAYAGDAFIISPLTQDIKNIELLLPSLTPDIMPVPGANPLAALTLAHKMLLNAGHLNGDIYWFTDDVDNEEIADIYDWSNKFGHQLNILGVGSKSGAPITLPSGELLKDNNGAIVVPRLPSQKLKSLASRGHGNYQRISNDDSDIDNLILKTALSNQNGEKNKNKKQQSQQTGDQWQEQGAWLLLLALPLMLSYFRRGSAILMLPLSCLPLLFLLSFSFVSTETYANNDVNNHVNNHANNNKEPEQLPASSTQKIWQDLWQTNDQQAQQHYNQKDYQSAAQQFDNPQWQGSAHYKAGNYQDALDSFKQGKKSESADSLYNQGNALAQMQQYEQAIKSYDLALKKNPDLQDAKDNIEKIKQQQKEQEKKQEQQQGDQSKDDQSKDKQSQNKKDQQQDSQNSESKDQQSQQQSDDSQKQKKDSNSEVQENDKQNTPKDTNKEQQDKKAEQERKEQQEKNTQKAESQEKQQGEEKTAAQIAAEQKAKETEQKHQQLLNKVTDDPYLLLRNKMQLEYQRRKQDGTNRGVKKTW